MFVDYINCCYCRYFLIFLSVFGIIFVCNKVLLKYYLDCILFCSVFVNCFVGNGRLFNIIFRVGFRCCK